MTDQPDRPTCDYLVRKGIRPYGVKITPADGVQISPFQIPPTYSEPDPNDPTGKKKRRYLPPVPPKSLVMPFHDPAGKIYMVQFILDHEANREWITKNNGNDKIYWPPGGEKKGNFFWYGGIPQPGGTVLVGEGYATMASAYEATGLPIVVVGDANNLEPALQKLLPYYPESHFLILADDDDFVKCQQCKAKFILSESDNTLCPHCNAQHKAKNTGVDAAMRACFDGKIKWIKPEFKEKTARNAYFLENKGKITDFNDLFQQEGLLTVKQQIESAIIALGWQPYGGWRDHLRRGGGGSGAQPSLQTTAECLDRYSLVLFHDETVFDHVEHKLVKLKDMRGFCRHRDVYTRWAESECRRNYNLESFGFDPTCKNEKIILNTFNGLTAKPKAGDPDIWLKAFTSLFKDEKDPIATAAWALKWLAYPLQHPGAKMQTALVLHGIQGTGKNKVLEALLLIYGKYSGIIGQAALENKFNDYIESKLFLIANEVVARSDVQHVKNMLKGLITDTQIWINPKNIAGYWIENHANMVFLSNEDLPVAIEQDDRRHMVVWVSKKLDDSDYAALETYYDDGGHEIIYDYLLNLPLSDFNEHTKPLMNDAKLDLIQLSRNSVAKFYVEWLANEIDGIPCNIPVLSTQLYEVYQLWCKKQGYTPNSLTNFSGAAKRYGVGKNQNYCFTGGGKVTRPRFLFPPNCEERPPAGDSEKYYFGDKVKEFNQAIYTYKGGAYDYVDN